MPCSVKDYPVTAFQLLPDMEPGIWQPLPADISPALIIFVAYLQTPFILNIHKCSKVHGKVLPL